MGKTMYNDMERKNKKDLKNSKTKEIVKLLKDLNSTEEISKEDMRRFTLIDKKLAKDLIAETNLLKQETIKEQIRDKAKTELRKKLEQNKRKTNYVSIDLEQLDELTEELTESEFSVVRKKLSSCVDEEDSYSITSSNSEDSASEVASSIQSSIVESTGPAD